MAHYPSKIMLAIQFLGGNNFNSWVWDMLEKFKQFGRDNNCHGIEATGRQGFWKWLGKTASINLMSFTRRIYK